MTRSTFLIIDGHSLAFRSYYAFAYRGEGGLRTSTGIPTSVCFGFVKALLDILEKEQPQAIAVAFDLAIPTFRHDADRNYKAGRAETPQDFIPDLHNLQTILAAMNVQIVTAPGFEADDVIGTLAQIASQGGYRVKIMSGDQDLFQLVDEMKQISVLHLGKADKIQEFYSPDVQAKLGVLPHQVPDFKALCGDASDNIPGVRGIGEKTAAKLLQEYQTLENTLNAIPTMQGALRKKLEEGRAAAQHSRSLSGIVLDVPIPQAIEAFRLQGFDRDRLIPLLEKLEFKAFMHKVDDIQRKMGGTVSPIEPVEEDLWFDFAPTVPEPMLTKPTLEVQIIVTQGQLQQLADILRQVETPIAWDTESTSLNPHEAEIVGVGCCWGKEIAQVAYIPLGHQGGGNLGREEFLAVMQPLLEDACMPKVLQNAKFDRLMFRSMGINLQGVVFDTMLASYVLDPEAAHGLSELGAKYLKLGSSSYQELVGKKASIAEISIEQVAQYCGLDAYFTYQLRSVLQAALEAIPSLWQLFCQIEVPLEPILAEMEWIGIRIDCDYLHQLSRELEQDLERIAHSAYQLLDRSFNLNSPKQLSEILLELLGSGFTQKSRKTAQGYSTDVTVLHKLQGDHPLIDIILEHRTLAKLKSTYVDALPSLVQKKTQRLHTDFNQTITATGRLSSSNPNLQNIPIRTSFSRRIRAGFLPQSDWLLLSADYSQIELRILAHLSQEPVLIQAYSAGIDVHTYTAQLLLEKETVSVEERRLAKIINYGVIYGMGAQKFAREAGISVREAKKFIDAFELRYPKIFSYMQSLEVQAETEGFVTTLAGRRRYFHDLKYATGQRKAALKRSAVNAPIQGTSADIIKLAMIKLHGLLKPYQTRLLLQVHDELVFEIPPEELAPLQPQIKQVMETAYPLSVPLVVDMHGGKNWMEAK